MVWQGLHIDDIAAKAGVDAMKLGKLSSFS